MGAAVRMEAEAAMVEPWEAAKAERRVDGRVVEKAAAVKAEAAEGAEEMVAALLVAAATAVGQMAAEMVVV